MRGENRMILAAPMAVDFVCPALVCFASDWLALGWPVFGWPAFERQPALPRPDGTLAPGTPQAFTVRPERLQSLAPNATRAHRYESSPLRELTVTRTHSHQRLRSLPVARKSARHAENAKLFHVHRDGRTGHTTRPHTMPSLCRLGETSSKTERHLFQEEC